MNDDSLSHYIRWEMLASKISYSNNDILFNTPINITKTGGYLFIIFIHHHKLEGLPMVSKDKSTVKDKNTNFNLSNDK